MYRKHSDSSLHEIAKKYQGRKEFSLKDPGAYRCAARRGLLDTICTHMVKNYPKKYSDEQLLAHMSKFKTLKEFRTKKPAIYQAIWKRLGKETFNAIRRTK